MHISKEKELPRDIEINVFPNLLCYPGPEHQSLYRLNARNTFAEMQKRQRGADYPEVA